MRHSRVKRLGLVSVGEEPPNEFRIFTAGDVDTSKGTFKFGPKEAAAVMADYEAHGAEIMIDYDHAALAQSPADPALAARAAGWCNLELRNGDLYAVNVRWTAAAAAALRAKEWRYYSPAFCTDENDRVTSLLNVAITNIPATRQLDPLMAASATASPGENAMSLEEFMKVIKALGLDMTMSLEDAMAKIKGEAPADPEDAAPPAGDGGADDATEAMAAPAMKPDEKPAAVAASISRLMRTSGKTSIVDALAETDVWRASHLELETERQKLSAERATLESAERRKGCADLVVAGAMKPAQVWADDGATTPKTYLAAMPIGDFREFVGDALKSCGGVKKSAAPRTPASSATGSGPAVELSAAEKKICEELKCDPVAYLALKNTRDSVRTNT